MNCRQNAIEDIDVPQHAGLTPHGAEDALRKRKGCVRRANAAFENSKS
jgi:hypothetical protein